MAASVELERLAGRVERLPFDSLVLAARVGKRLVVDVGRAYGGPDGLKGKKRRGMKLGARDTIKDYPSLPNATVVRIQGSVPAWIWVSSGTEPHAIRRRRRGPLRKMTVRHPGWRNPPGLWERAAVEVVRVVPEIFAREAHRAVEGG